MRNAARSAAATAVALLLVSACGSEAAQRGTDPAPAIDPLGAKLADCSVAEGVTAEELSKAAGVADTSVFAELVNSMPLPSLEAASRSGERVLEGTVSEIRAVSAQPLSIVPAGEGRGAASLGGDPMLWRGVEIDVEAEVGVTTVQVPLVAGGRDVIAASGVEPDVSSFESLVGACALVITGRTEGPTVLGGPRLVAVSTDQGARPVAFDPQLAAVVEAAPTLRALSAG
jgi:hypothetical protein